MKNFISAAMHIHTEAFLSAADKYVHTYGLGQCFHHVTHDIQQLCIICLRAHTKPKKRLKDPHYDFYLAAT